MSNIAINKIITPQEFSNTVAKKMFSQPMKPSFYDAFKKELDGLPLLNENGGAILRGEVIVVKPDETPATVESLQKDLGITKEEAENILKRAAEPPIKEIERTPESYKAYLQSKQVDAVAYDVDGRVAAKIYTDGSIMCDNYLMSEMLKCNTNADKIRLLQSQHDVRVVDYSKEKVTEFDLLKDDIAWQEQALIRHPEFINEFTYDEIAFQKRTLAL